MLQTKGKLLLKSSECYNLIQLPWQRSTRRRSVSPVWVFSVAPLCLPGRCSFTTSPGAGPRVIPLVLSCGDEEEKHEQCSQLVVHGRGGENWQLLTVTFICRFLGLSVTVIIIFCIPVGKNVTFSAILKQANWIGHTHTHTQLTQLLAVEHSSFHIPHSQSLDKTLHKPERKWIRSTVWKLKLQQLTVTKTTNSNPVTKHIAN